MSSVPAVLADLRRRLRRMLWLRGLALGLAILCGAATLAAAADAWWRIEGPLGRGLLTLAVLVLGVVAGWRLLRRPLSGAWDDVSVALLVEQTRPAARDQLASAAEFAHSESRMTSDPWRQLAVQTAETVLSCEPIERLVDPRRLRPAVLTLLAVVAVPLLWLILDPARAVLAFERQWSPLSARDWPRVTRLELLTDDLTPLSDPLPPVVADEPLTMSVGNLLGKLPRDLRLECRSDNGSVSAIELTRTLLRDAAGKEREIAVATWTPPAGLLQLRAVGGDDLQMPWREFEVRPMPRLEQFRVQIEPPVYSGLPVIDEQRSTGHVEALVGSTVRLRATSNVPLQAAWFHREGQPAVDVLEAATGEVRAQFTIANEGRSPGWFELRDNWGLTSTRTPKYELRGRRDQPPQAQWRLNAQPRTAVSQAYLPLVAECSDDLGLGLIALHWSLGEGTRAGTLSLSTTADGEDPNGTTPGRARRVAFDWQLTPLELQPGVTVNYWLEVVDLRTPEPQRSQTTTGTLQIVSLEDKSRELEALQSGLAEATERVLQRNADAAAVLRALQTQWSVAGVLRPADQEALRTIDHARRQTLADLTAARGGLAPQIANVLDEIAWNRLGDRPTRDRMQRLQVDLQSLLDVHLPQLNRNLATLQPLCDAGTATTPAASNAHTLSVDATQFESILTAVLSDHAAVLSGLQEMLDELVTWRRQVETTRWLEELLTKQRNVQSRTTGLARVTLSHALTDLTPQQRADLATLADQQRHLGVEAASLAAQSVPLPSDTTRTEEERSRSAIDTAGLASQMQQAAAAIDENQLAVAATLQANLLSQLTSALDHAAKSSVETPEALAAWLEQTRITAAQLREQQADLADRMARENLSTFERVERKQFQAEQLAVSTDLTALSGELRRRRFVAATSAIERALAASQLASEAILDAATASIGTAQQRVLEELQSLDDALAMATAAAEQQRLLSVLATLADSVRALHESQSALAVETEDLEAQRVAASRWGRGELQRLSAATREQQRLTAEAEALRISTAGVPLVESLLQSVTAQMSAATAQLTKRDAGRRTVAAQRDAVLRLQLLREVLDAPADAPSEETPSEPATTAPPANAQALALEWDLLLALQGELLARTESVQRKWRQTQGDDDLREQLQELADDQDALGLQTRDLLNRLHAATPDSQPSTGRQ